MPDYVAQELFEALTDDEKDAIIGLLRDLSLTGGQIASAPQ